MRQSPWYGGKPIPTSFSAESLASAWKSPRSSRVPIAAIDLDPLSLLLRLCAAVPAPRVHTVRYCEFVCPYVVTTQTPGMSAVQFQRQLGLKRYETAFQILHNVGCPSAQAIAPVPTATHAIGYMIPHTWLVHVKQPDKNGLVGRGLALAGGLTTRGGHQHAAARGKNGP